MVPVRRVKQPSLSQLRAFAAVAEHLHFRDAAASIGMSQPALSGAVSALEEALGVQLLERTTRRVLLSPAGERLAARTGAVLDAVGELMEEAEAAQAPFTGVLRLGVIPTVAPYLLPTVLRLVHTRYPELDLQVHEEQTSSLLEGLAAGRLDLLLLAVPLGVPGVVELPLFDEDFVLVAPEAHPLAGRDDIPREALRGLRLLLLDEGHCLRDQALAVCERAGAVESVEVRATSLPTLVQMVAGGLGVTLLPEAAAEALVQPRGPVELAEFAKPPGRMIGLAWRTSSARLREFRLLAETMSECAEKYLGKLRAA